MGPRSFDPHGFVTATRSIPWCTLRALGVRAASPDGPFANGPHWQLWLREGVLERPASPHDDLEVLAEHLPGFDFDKAAAALSSATARPYRVWHPRDAPQRLDRNALRARFVRLAARLCASDARGVQAAFASLAAAWSAPARHYHDLEHLSECLVELDRAAPAEAHDRLELALFYHDAIYEAGAADAEARSAAWLLRNAAELGLERATAGRAAELVAATVHRPGQSLAGDAAWMCDIDLAILGRDPLRFLEYEHAVAQEFAAVPPQLFLRGRAHFLRGLLDAPIYRTAWFRARYEQPARAQITALLASARYRDAH